LARKLYYKVLDNGKNIITDDEWEEISRLQWWYNSEFIWTAGKLGFRIYAVFPNPESHIKTENIVQVIRERRKLLRSQGFSEVKTILKLEEEGLVILQKGGYYQNCLASGFTRVAGNEFNAYLVCEFILKASRIATSAEFILIDEGQFIKTKSIILKNGVIYLKAGENYSEEFCKHIIENRKVFSLVNPAKYDNHPVFKNEVSDFNNMTLEEKFNILKDWNYLGYGNNFDKDGNDTGGIDLNTRVTDFVLI